MLQRIDLCRFEAEYAKIRTAVASSRWHSRTKLENPWKYFYNCQEETSVAVLQDHVTGEVYNIQPRNIA